MNRERFISEIENLKICDAHTHLVGSKLCAVDFWQIVHYFWFLRELQGAGYPENCESLNEDERVNAFLPAFNKTKGTGMNYAVRRIFRDLYGLEITGKQSVYACIEKVRASAVNPGWAMEVAAKGNIKYAVVNNEDHKQFTGLDGVSVWVPRFDGRLNEAANNIFNTLPGQRAKTAETEKAGLLDLLSDSLDKGARAFMTTLGGLNKKTWQNSGESFASLDDCYIFLLHAVCAFAETHNAVIQFFMGIERSYFGVAGSGEAAPVNNNERVLNLYGLFEKYKIKFDLVTGADGGNMDVVQAANIFRNVYVGGMWWFNFRPSTYADAMAKRFEALASNKTYLSISDSRCIEWCYGKNTLIRKLARDFLIRKVDEGFVDFNDALDIARDWLCASAEGLYVKPC